MKDSAEDKGPLEGLRDRKEKKKAGDKEVGHHAHDRDSLEGQMEVLRGIMIKKMGSDKIPLSKGKVDWSKIHFDVKNELYSLGKMAGKLDSVNVSANHTGRDYWETKKIVI